MNDSTPGVSPIHNLPPELLLKIFYLVVPPSQGGSDNTDRIVDEAHRVSQTCRRWRQISHNAPELWVGLRFSTTQKNPTLEMQQTTAWLKRSHPLPITIYFCHRIGGHLGHHFTETQLFRILLSTTHRWKHIIWDIPAISPLCDLHLGSLEALERFTIVTMSFRSPPKPIDVLLSVPRLREVAICTRSSHILELLLIPWNQLTSLTLENDITVKDCRDIMLQCTNMLLLKISSCKMNVWETSHRPAVLPVLHTFEIHFRHFVQATFDHFFAYLSLLALKSFKLSLASSQPMRWDMGSFCEFQRRSPNVEKFAVRLQGKRVDADNLVTLLQHSPTITGLAIDGSPIGDVLVRSLEVNENEPQVLAPNLVDLELDATRLSISALQTMIRSRWRDSMVAGVDVSRVASLKKLVLNHSTDGLETILQPLRDEGFNIRFSQ
ncbi:hypothetical protein C8R45DRAFT_207994 [Mycena sanguinolenta]|nr:hypothetical protein C8R45DRAFT_207994 [Mycena sanguinolenta]